MNKYFVKCDLSGIQDFIFDVKTEGAAKELKRRSLYVSHLTKQLLEEDHNHFVNNFKTIYEGGGNYYISFTSDEDIAKIREYFINKSRRFLQDDLFPHFAVVSYNDDFSKAMQEVNQETIRVKQQREILLEPYISRDVQLPEIKKGEGINFHFPKDESEDGKLENKDKNKKDKVKPLDFDKLAFRAEGDKKLAALKIDVDHLGMVFRDRLESEYDLLSHKLKVFFDKELLELIHKNEYSNQVYVVFAGGDDCFLIGCWHTMVELALKIRDEFQTLSKDLKAKIKDLHDITLSAGLIIFHPSYPVRQLADEVDSFLNKAKQAGRNRITIFGQPLRWDEYRTVLEIKDQLFNLVEKKGESKSLIHKVRSSEIGYLSIQRKIRDKGLLDMPKVWKLKYYLHNVKKENKEAVKKLFDEYTKSLIHDFMNKDNAINPLIYPIAARLAELQTQKRSKDE